ncbi:hypothetical protein [Corynebacterium meridianum]|uniref:Sensory transduction regulator n=1 Tax=Corynebacterium meridianum TaxID=2765363 RepID=A0A934M8L1_9CORY|nr:hypothetical protein [Corynebacterium meridianum]MBI8989240.1 hypothetical protein [Corynebacterium meridianum]
MSSADHGPDSTGEVPDDPSGLFPRDAPTGELNRGLRLTLLRLLGPAPLRALRRRRNRTSDEPTVGLTFGMVEAALETFGVRHSVTTDRIMVSWPSVRGELLVIRDNGGLHLVFRGRLRGRTGVEQLPVLQNALALGEQRSLPVCFYPSVAADGTLSVRFHASLCVEAGITDAQLRTFLERALILVITGCLALIDEIPPLAGPAIDSSELLRTDAVESTRPVPGAVVPGSGVPPLTPAIPEPLDMYRLRIVLERMRGDAEPHPRFRALALTVDEVEVQVTSDTEAVGSAGRDLIVISRWEVPVEGAATEVFGEAATACAAFDRRCPTVNARAALVSGTPDRVVVCAVAVFPVAAGATDAQLEAAINCGITGVVEAVTVIRGALSRPR